MNEQDYLDHDAVGLGEAVRKGEASATELVDIAIARAERLNPKLNAIVYEDYENARKVAKSAGREGLFAGVPFLVKDLGMSVAGMRRTSGSRFLKDVVDTEDSGITKRWRASGLIFLGKSNTPEFGIPGVTESQLLGPCRNPWNTDHTPGGSSGGAASATAAGIVPMAHASDGLGSIRIPAACCGLVGLKVTRDRNPNLPEGAENILGNAVDHVVSRTVRDSAAMLDVIGLPEPGTPYAYPARPESYLKEIEKGPGKLKIRWSSETARGRPIDPEIEEALAATAELLGKLGHEVDHQGLGIDYMAMYNTRGAAAGANFAATIQRWIEKTGAEPQGDDFETLTWASYKSGRKVMGADAFHSLGELRRLSRDVVRKWEEFDVYLCPVLGTPPSKIGWIDTQGLEPRELNKRQAAAYPYTPIFNFTGQPSLSLPLAWTKSGLPIGMMFTGRYGDEATLLKLARQIEREAPWAGRKPGVW